MTRNRGILWALLGAVLFLRAPGMAGGPVVEATGLVASIARQSCGAGAGTCRSFGGSNLTVDLSSGAGVLTTTDEHFCSLGTRGNEVFAPGACRSSKSGKVTCLGSGSVGGEVWTSRLTLSPSGELSFTKKWVYDQSPWNGECSSTYVLEGRLVRF